VTVAIVCHRPSTSSVHGVGRSHGDRAEAAVASALIRVGKPVFLPAFGMNSRVDLVYLVPAAGLPTRCCSLRLAPARNG
jgi:hypothetical protein